MKHFTKNAINLLNTSIIFLACFILTATSLQAKDLIDVVLDSNLDFETNNGSLPPTKIYNDFNTTVNFTPFNLFDLSTTDFPVNIDGYFKPNSSQVQLVLNQNNFANLKQSKPNHILINIPVANGKNFTLTLNKHNPLSNDFQFKDINGDSIAFDEGLHYQGIVQSNSTSWATISIFDNYVRALIIDYEGIYVLSAIHHFEEHYLLYNDKKLAIPYYANLTCGVDELPQVGQARLASRVSRAKIAQNKPIKISIETDFALFKHQQNFQNVYNYVSATLNEAAALMANQSIQIQLSEVVAWDTEDGYNKNYAYHTLQEFGERRKNDFNGDLLHLFTSEYRDIGGIANIEALGSCYTYFPQEDINYGPYGVSIVDFWPCVFGLYHFDVWTFVHELGHNLGARHTHDPVWNVNGMANKSLDNGQLCNDPNINCFDEEASPAILQKTGGSVMSYYVATPNGASFYRGYGTQPGNLIRASIDQFFNKGCMQTSACNYNPAATQEDGSCIFGNQTNDDSIFDEIPWLNGKVNKKNCTNQSVMVYTNAGENFKNVLINNNGCIENYNCNAFLNYGEIPDYNTINIISTWACTNCNGNVKGCTNTNACNYNPQATFNDGTCNFGDTTCSDTCNPNCTCIKLTGTNSAIFNQYPWLANAINYTGLCNFKKITEYDFSSYQLINIEFNDGTAQLFRDNGQFYCTTNLCYDCLGTQITNPTLAEITCYTCASPTETCNATGVVSYKICDGGQWYYLIETTDGEIIDPYNNQYNINFDCVNGTVVNFSYIEEFPSNCEYAAKSVQINCIETVEYPCNYSHSGTVMYQTCDDGLSYYLIEMDNGEILDPYNSGSVNFNYVAGDLVEFEYLPYNQTYCNLSDVAGIITCIRSIACNNTGIVFYNNCNSNNYLIQTTDGVVINPINQSNSGYNFTNGDVVKFGFSNTFASPCTEAAYSANLTCIKSTNLPCTNTGNIITEVCNGIPYTLIDMEDEGILDPYLSPIVNFVYEEGATVEFAYMPFSYSACSAALQSGIITCIQNICRNNVRIVNGVPIEAGTTGDAKHLIAYGEVFAPNAVTLKASNRITLDVGFKVEAGATFRAINGGCQ